MQAAEEGQRRWLMKAVREAAGELYQQLSGVRERHLRWRPYEDEWCLKEVAAHMRDAEQLYQRQIELIANRREPRLPHEAIDVLPSERDYRDDDADQLLQEYAYARDETVWLLRMLDEDGWERCGLHPYRGRISIHDVVREMHEHDLEHLYQARRLREQVSQLRRER
ncbi:MAG: DinB family protein [Dehalococcoidia bacterium]